VVPAPQSPAKAPSNAAQPASSQTGSSTLQTNSVPLANGTPNTTTATKAPATPTRSPTPKPSEQSASAEYWIQVGSFTQKATADGLRSEFTNRGMTAIISQKEIGGRTYYQVKVGPYATSQEAKQWLATVKSVKGASQDAFITTR